MQHEHQTSQGSNLQLNTIEPKCIILDMTNENDFS
jgi:hypothetical protein